jgi:hypothetical protein
MLQSSSSCQKLANNEWPSNDAVVSIKIRSGSVTLVVRSWFRNCVAVASCYTALVRFWLTKNLAEVCVRRVLDVSNCSLLCVVVCCYVTTLADILVFRRVRMLRKATICFVMSVRPPACNNSAPTGRIFIKFDILNIFRKSVEKIEVSLKSDNNNGTLHEDLCTFMVISRWILLRMRNVSDKSCRENQNIHFMFNNFFPKIVPFMR